MIPRGRRAERADHLSALIGLLLAWRATEHGRPARVTSAERAPLDVAVGEATDQRPVLDGHPEPARVHEPVPD